MQGITLVSRQRPTHDTLCTNHLKSLEFTRVILLDGLFTHAKPGMHKEHTEETKSVLGGIPFGLAF